MENKSSSTYWAYQILHVGFSALPVLAGIDKFTNLLTHWDMYLAHVVVKSLPVSTSVFMRTTGVIEICAGIIVAVKPRIGSLVVCGWLLAIIINYLLAGGFYDIALRDFGLSLGALALFFLSRECHCKAS